MRTASALCCCCSARSALRRCGFTRLACFARLARGVVGNSVAQFLQASVGFTGATVIMLVAIAIGLSLFLDFSWLAVAERFGVSRRLYAARGANVRRLKIARSAKPPRRCAKQRLSDERERIDEAPPVTSSARRACQAVRAQAEGKAGAAVCRDGRCALPPLDLLDEPPPNLEAISTETLEFTSRLIEKKLRDFNVEAVVVAAYRDR